MRRALRRAVAGRDIPVLTTYRAKGVVPDSWPNAAGLFTGFPREGLPLAAADVIVTVGLDPVELLPAEWRWEAPVVALCDILPADRAPGAGRRDRSRPARSAARPPRAGRRRLADSRRVLAVGNARRDRRAGRRSRAAGRRASSEVGTAAGDDRDDRRRRAHARDDAVLGCRGAAPMSDLERPGDDGLRAARRDRRQLRTRGAGGLLHRRRRSRHVRG